MDTGLARAQSAELAAVLGAGDCGMKGGIAPRRATRNERRMLDALIRAGGAATPADLIAARPKVFADSSVAGLHLTGASLVRKGWAKRGRKTTYRADGSSYGGSRLYRITAEGRNA
jgi:hypothetical protein